jgi:P-loop Domain of unknown function (DUF2791)
MSGALKPDEWVTDVSRFYLDDFIAGGGSAVKFVVCYDDAPVSSTIEDVAEAAHQRGYLTAEVHAETTRIHQIERLFGAIADQLPWSDLVDGVLRAFATDKGWVVPDRFDARGLSEQLDELNDLGADLITMDLRRSVSNRIFRNRQFAKEFRVAMTWLAHARITGGPKEVTDFEYIGDWLGVRLHKISTMRDYMIFAKVNRANARHLLGSMLAWIRLSGPPGLVVNLDASRLLRTGFIRDGTINYSKAALLDAYEVLRQFIDATDDMEGLLLNIFVPPMFLDLETTGRGIGRYPALMYRVYDEIRDRQLANPLTALVRLSGTRDVV